MVGYMIAIGVSRTSRCRSGIVGVSGQRLGGLSGGLLDSTSVVVLVPSEGGTTGESLLACGVRTLVRSLSRMDATMPSKRAGITKGLRISDVSSLPWPTNGHFQQFIYSPFHNARTCAASRQYEHADEQSRPNAE